jgi:HNH endonuclease
MPKLPSLGRCIYCSETHDLTDEHIMPTALGGTLWIEKASCRACAKITHKYEQAVTRGMYWPLRLRLGIKGSRKHKKERPTHWLGVIEDGDDINQLPIEIDKLPRMYPVMIMPPPGILTGAPLTESNPELEVQLKGDNAELAQFLREVDAGRFKFTFNLQWHPFSRMIAKICHAFVVGMVGLDGIDFLLPPLIREQSNYLAQFVGGVSAPEDALKPPNDLGLAFREIHDGLFIVGRTTMFGNNRFPTYEAVVGKVVDQDLISRNIATRSRDD